MPTPRVLMSKIRQALRLLADAGLSMRQVAAALGVSKSTVSEIAMYARDVGVDWPLAATLSDDELQARLYPPPRPRSSTRQEPDYAGLHQELKRPGVTLMLLFMAGRSAATGGDLSALMLQAGLAGLGGEGDSVFDFFELRRLAPGPPGAKGDAAARGMRMAAIEAVFSRIAAMLSALKTASALRVLPVDAKTAVRSCTPE